MKFKIVIIDSVWDSLNEGTTKDFLHKVFIAKKNGYGSRHTEDYLAIGKEDMICNHVMICKIHNGEWRPVCISKIVLSSKLIKYGLEHPTTAIMRGHFEDSYYTHIEKMIEELISSGKELSYSGGFTVDREMLKGKEELNLLKEIYCGMHTHIHVDRNVHTLFGFSCPRLNTDKIFNRWGILPVELNGKTPSGYPDELHNEEVKCITAKVSNLSDYSYGMAEKYKHLWLDRIDTSKEEEEVPTAA